MMLVMSYAALFVFSGLFWFGLPVIWSLTFVLPASMRAAGDVKFAMVTSIISMWIFRIMAAYLLAKGIGMGALGVWIAMISDWLFRAIVFSIRWFSGKWKNKSVVQQWKK